MQDLDVDGSIILQRIIKMEGGLLLTGLVWLRIGQINFLVLRIKQNEFLDVIRHDKLLNTNSVSWFSLLLHTVVHAVFFIVYVQGYQFLDVISRNGQGFEIRVVTRQRCSQQKKLRLCRDCTMGCGGGGGGRGGRSTAVTAETAGCAASNTGLSRPVNNTARHAFNQDKIFRKNVFENQY